MTLTTRVHDLAGSLVLDLAPAGGYRRRELASRGVVWDKLETSSPFVDGDFEDHFRKTSPTRTEVIRVDGPSWPVIEERTDALEAAVTAGAFLWVIGKDGVLRTWRSTGPSDVDASFTRSDLVALRRFVILTFKVAPNPTVTTPGGP